MVRPKHTRKDRNHAQVISVLRQVGCVVIDVSDLPGVADCHPLDLFVLAPDHSRWVQVEVKAGPNASFTPSEQAYLQHMDVRAPIITATSATDILRWFRQA